MLSGDQKMRLQGLFAQGAELPIEERPAFCAREARDDAALRLELEGLLELLSGDDESFLAAPLADLGAPLAEMITEAEQLPRRIGPYRAVECIGEGGMGTVYRAEQVEPVQRMVAVKVIKAGMDTEDVLARFARERGVLARMSHEHIARVFDAGQTEHGLPYFVMELVDGPPIHRYCESHKLDLDQRLRLMLQICVALGHAHQKGVVHRDLKPGNILVATYDGAPVVKVIDFGLARAMHSQGESNSLRTMPGMVLGTPEYMAPEQAEGDLQAIDARTDIYALGVILYELLTGSRPFSQAELLRAGPLGLHRTLRELMPRRPSSRVWSAVTDERTSNAPSADVRKTARALRAGLDWIVLRAIAKDPDDRYQSADELADDLHRYLAGEPIAARRPSAAQRLVMFTRRRKGIVSVAVLLFAILVTGLTVSVQGLIETRSARAHERASRALERQTMDPLRVNGLLSRAREPWPAATTYEGNSSAIQDWIDEADLILSRAEDHRADLQDGRVGDAETRVALNAMLDQLPALRSARTEVATRHGILARHWPLWQTCQASLRGVDGFEQVGLGPIPNLVPLGIDEDRNRTVGRQVHPLWVFAVPGTGRVPEWVDGNSEPVPYGTPGHAKRNEDNALLLILVPGGEFWRGTQRRDPNEPNFDAIPRRPGEADDWNEPVQRVRVAPFLVSKHEVTRAQYDRYAEATARTPSPVHDATERGDHAVRGVDWRDASLFCKWTGLALLGETRWEYMARAGTTTPYWSGPGLDALAQVGWYHGNKRPKRSPVGVSPTGEGAPNPWGIHDVHGGVREWCQDEGTPSWESGPADDSVRAIGRTHRIVRGGSFECPPGHCLSGFRRNYPPGCHYPNMGIRASLSLQ